jgi:DNA replication and repair protein RecF
MVITAVIARPLRTLDGVEVGLPDGVTAVLGENGSGKTNLLEALYFALTGRSFRTGDRRELIPFAQSIARSEVRLRDESGAERCFLASISRSEGRRHLLDGSAVDSDTATRNRPPVAVFSPDRLALVKGPPAERRAHIDLFAATRWPSRVGLRRRYGQALAQRNALLHRVNAGAAAMRDLESWDAALAEAAVPLIASRAEATAELAPHFEAAGAELGFDSPAAIAYAPRAEGDAEQLRAGLEERREADLRLGRSSWGPHLDEVRLTLDGRSLRRYGSQGQQRLALLALLFAERESLLRSRGAPPLMLLDDVMSELDGPRRERLSSRLEDGGQALITATEEGSVPPRLATAAVWMPAGQRRPQVVAA